VLRLRRPDFDGLNKLLHLSNKVVQEYGQPALYTKIPLNTKNSTGKSPSKKFPSALWAGMEDLSDAFHISIAWTLTSPDPDLLKLTKAIATDHMKGLDQIQIEIGELKSKVGNAVTNIPLPKAVSVGKGLFGS
jgi:hypothetical protein